MKNLMIVLLVIAASSFTNQITAQTACTPAQIEACKKICADNTACTPAQAAACKKVCASKATTAQASAVKVVNKAPADKTKKSCSATKVASSESSLTKLVGLNLEKVEKKQECAKTCVGKKKESN